MTKIIKYLQRSNWLDYLIKDKVKTRCFQKSCMPSHCYDISRTVQQSIPWVGKDILNEILYYWWSDRTIVKTLKRLDKIMHYSTKTYCDSNSNNFS